MTEKRIAAVVPVKSFSNAKQRLSPVLSGEERHQLARAMLQDVLSVLSVCVRLDTAYVVTNDPDATAMGRMFGANILDDPMVGGLSGALTFAAHTLKARGYTDMLIVPADIPGIEASSVDAMLSVHPQAPAVTIVGAPSDGGTNALLCSPPDVIPNCFGHQSFLAHCAAAASAGIRPNILNFAGVQCDIDRPSDLIAFLACPTQTKTYSYLCEQRIARRLSCATLPGRPVAPGHMTAAMHTFAVPSLQKG